MCQHPRPLTLCPIHERGGGVSDRKNELEAVPCGFYPKCGSFKDSLSEPLLVQNKECVHEMCSFDWGPLPSSVYLGTTVGTDVIHMIK